MITICCAVLNPTERLCILSNGGFKLNGEEWMVLTVKLIIFYYPTAEVFINDNENCFFLYWPYKNYKN